jgi:hypothetical protein
VAFFLVFSKSEDEIESSSRRVFSACLTPVFKPPSLVISALVVCLPHTTQNFNPKFKVVPQNGQDAGI